MTITAEKLRALLSYDEETGIFTWRVKPARRIMIGAVAGTVSGGYRQIRIEGVIYYAHRLAWLYMTGEWPEAEIDHRDTNPGNNSWTNLRKATRAQNAANLGRSKVNRSGFKGVCWHAGDSVWMARIRDGGKTKYLGSFISPNEAHAAYFAAAEQLHGEFARAA